MISLSPIRSLIQKFFPTTNVFSNSPATLHSVISEDRFYIDEQTHNDLSLAEVESMYNNTFTTFGDEVFYHWIHSLKSVQELDNIKAETLFLLESSGIRNYAIKKLSKIGKQYRGSLISDLWHGLNYRSRLISNIFPFIILHTSLLVFFLLSFPTLHLFFISIYALLNLSIYIATNRHITKDFISSATHDRIA